MAARVDLIDDAIEDLERYQHSGVFPVILKKLLYIAEAPLIVGVPLGAPLATFRKVVFGNRTWRIIFRPEPDGSAATVWVIGDRSDGVCYELAKARLASQGTPADTTRTVLERALELLAQRAEGSKSGTRISGR